MRREVINFPITTNISPPTVEESSKRESQNPPDELHEEVGTKRPRRTIVKLARYQDENFISTYSCFFAGPINDEEPSSFEEAKGIKEWELAIDAEMDALAKNQTWSLVPKPDNVQTVPCK